MNYSLLHLRNVAMLLPEMKYSKFKFFLFIEFQFKEYLNEK